MTKFTIDRMAAMAPLFDGPGHTAGTAELSAVAKLTRLAQGAGRYEEAFTIGLTTAEWFALDEERGH